MSQRFVKKRLATYLDRLWARGHPLDSDSLGFFQWLVEPRLSNEVILRINALLPKERRRQFEKSIEDSCYDSLMISHEIDLITKTSRSEIVNSIRRVLRKALDDCMQRLAYAGMSPVEQSLSLFQQMFRLGDLELEICLFVSIIQSWYEARSFFDGDLHCDTLEGRNYLAIVLNATDAEIAAALNGNLAKIGILERDHHCAICLESSFSHLLYAASPSDVKTEFFKRIDPHPVPMDAHVVDPNVTRRLLTLLDRRAESSTHVLLYGPPGTGKTSYALGLVKELGLPAYVVEHAGKERAGRRFAFTASVNVASNGEQSILIADDCDSVLGTKESWSLFGETSDKRWLHDLLETPGVRMIWTVNSTTQIEESVARRFSFSLEFKPFTVAQRVMVWKSTLADHGLADILGAANLDELARRFEASPGVIEQAVRKAAETGCDAPETLLSALDLSLEAHHRLMSGGRKGPRANTVDPNFSLEGLNVAGADLKDLISELKAYDEWRKSSGTNAVSTMALLFHGPSGTGKSHFARHLAALLDRQVLFKRGSDLLSMWVGGTEQNIRDTYQEAAAKEAVLVFDEADSLVFSRDRAIRSWEISHTNEFLTWMEEFEGIQIFTTNRFSDLDGASLRRFNHKIEFRHLTPEGNLAMYCKLLSPLVKSRMSKPIASQLRAISRLAPGDFRIVMDKVRFRDSRSVTHEFLVEALGEEARAKATHSGEKSIGF